ncbi:MAG: dTDP-4-dehydrorhamnose 3,5-epimerase family protein [Geminicoccaceae bacterium]
MPSPDPALVPIFLLCGGQGTRLGEASVTRPKPMIDIGEQPMLLHIMRWYARFGFRRFILCVGHRGEVISAYFSNLAALTDDFTVDLATRNVSYHQSSRPMDWEVTVAYTGARTMTGGRLARAAARYLGEADFGVSYGDGLTDADLAEEWRFHLGHDRLATVLSVQPPSQFGRLVLNADGTASSPEAASDRAEHQWRLPVLPPRFLDYVSPAEDCACSKRASHLSGWAARASLAYHHGGYWSCVDTIRDRDQVQSLREAVPHPGSGERHAPARPARHAGPRGRAAPRRARLVPALLLPCGAGAPRPARRHRAGQSLLLRAGRHPARPALPARPQCGEQARDLPPGWCSTWCWSAPRLAQRYGRNAAVELSPHNRRSVLVPQGCAHGFLSTEPASQMLYLVTAAFDPLRERVPAGIIRPSPSPGRSRPP